ncbi:prepilin peptidase [Cronobacter turicensis]
MLSLARWSVTFHYGCCTGPTVGCASMYEGLGYGDVKFLGALGAWHGWQMLGLLLVIASVLGLIAVFVLYQLKGRPLLCKTPLPFGPFMAVAGLICSGATFQILNL